MSTSYVSRPSRRTVLRGGLACATLGAVATGPAAGATTRAAGAARAGSGGPFVPYGRRSFFKSTVEGAPVDRAATAAFADFMASHPDQRDYAYPRINGLDGNMWGTAWARGAGSDPIWTLTGSVPQEVQDLSSRGFHAPAWFGDLLTGTSDSPFVVMDRGMRQSVWAANAKVVGRYTINVSTAGRFVHRSNGLDRRNPRSSSEQNFRSRGAIPDAMVIRHDLVQAGIANGTGLGHVLHMFIAESDSSAGFCHPMVGAEHDNFGFGAEGQRIAISSSVDLAGRGLSPAALVVARTLQRHGCYIGDNSGSSSALKAQQWSAGHDPWQGMLRQDSLAGGVTWADFVVLPKGWQ